MTMMHRLKLWGRALWAGLEAAEEVPFGATEQQLAALAERVGRLERAIAAGGKG